MGRGRRVGAIGSLRAGSGLRCQTRFSVPWQGRIRTWVERGRSFRNERGSSRRPADLPEGAAQVVDLAGQRGNLREYWPNKNDGQLRSSKGLAAHPGAQHTSRSVAVRKEGPAACARCRGLPLSSCCRARFHPPGDRGKLVAGRVLRCAGDVREQGLDRKAGPGGLLGQRLGGKILQPVVHCSRPLCIDDGVPVEHDLFPVVLERVERAVVPVR